MKEGSEERFTPLMFTHSTQQRFVFIETMIHSSTVKGLGLGVIALFNSYSLNGYRMFQEILSHRSKLIKVKSF